MIDFTVGDRVQYVKGHSNCLGLCGTVVEIYDENDHTYAKVKLDSDERKYDWYTWRLQRVDDDFLPSDQSLEVLL